MRIVLLAPDLTGTSGWSRYALDLGRALAARGHDMHCITMHAAGMAGETWCREYPILRKPTSYLGSPLLSLWDSRKLSKLLRTIAPDVVHVIAEPYALMLPFMRKQRWKEILTIHGTYSVVPLLMGYKTAALASAYYKRMDTIVAVSEFTKEYLGKRVPALAPIASKIQVVHNAISLDGIDMDSGERNPGKPFSILSVSGVKKKKGYLQSLRAIRTFLEEHHVPVTYTIIGNKKAEPSFMHSLREATEALSLGQIVDLCGMLPDNDVDAAYRSADLFLLPSLQENDYFEGFGLVFIEANARGTPVIGGKSGGCPEAIKEGVSGYVCDPENTHEIAARMGDILIRKTIDRSACRAWAEEHDINRVIPQFEAIYASA